MPCPTFKCDNPDCTRVHECNRDGSHTEGHMEALAMIKLPAVRAMRGKTATIRPSAFRIVAVW